MSERTPAATGSEWICPKCGDTAWSDHCAICGAPKPTSAPEILDACCGGRMWWWDKEHPLAVYMDNRVAPPGSVQRAGRTWSCEPDVLGDFRAMPFDDGSFQLVLFDPPHIVRPNPSGYVAMHYGTLHPDTEKEDLRRGFSECWRVLALGGTLVFKWAGELKRVRPYFPTRPVVGTRQVQAKSSLGTRWFIFYKPLAEAGASGQIELVA